MLESEDSSGPRRLCLLCCPPTPRQLPKVATSVDGSVDGYEDNQQHDD